MNADDQSQVGRLAKILQDIEQGCAEQDESSLSDEDIQQLRQAKRALGRLERLTSGSASTQLTPIQTAASQVDTRPNSNTLEAELEVDPNVWHVSESPQSFPQRFGRFQIERVLGRGGFGVVLLAKDPKLDQQVALKIPRSELLLSDEGRGRLLREARAATILSHPNIVPIYESGFVGVVPYISFGFCSGPTLSEWMDSHQGELTPRLAAQIVARLAGAAQHAHSRGIVHRDLKPSNVMFASEIDSDAGEDQLLEALRIADFGLATSSSEQNTLTRTGSPLGTPAYMSPEQARGDSDIGVSSDIFSIGVILYELITGTQPFKRSTDVATLRAVEESFPPSASRIVSSVPKDLSAIANKCLEKRGQDRYKSASDLERDLHRYLAKEPVSARPVGGFVQLTRWCSRNPVVSASLLFAFLSLATGLALSLSYARAAKASELAALKSARQSESRYNQALSLSGLFHTTYDSFRDILRDDLVDKGDKAKELKEKLVDTTRDHYKLVVAQRPTDREVLREYVNMLRPMAYQLQLLGDQQTSSEIWKEASDILASEFPDEVGEWAAITGKLVEDYSTLQRADEAVATAELIVNRLSTAEEEGEGDRRLRVQLVHALTSAAMAIKGGGKFEAANDLLDEAVALVCEIEDCDVEDWPVNKTWARVLRTKCETLEHLADNKQILFLAPLGISQYEGLKEDPKYIDLALDSIPSFHNAIAGIHAEAKDYEQAIVHFEQALSLQEELIERHPQMGGLYFNATNARQRIAQIRSASGDQMGAISDAESQIERIQRLASRFPELKPAMDRQLLEAYWIFAMSLYRNDQNALAIENAENGIELVQAMSGDDAIPLSVEGRLGTLYSIKAFANAEPATKKAAIEQAIFHLQNALRQGGSPIYQVDLDSALQLRNQLAQ